MITAERRALPRIDALREEFDKSFAKAPELEPAARTGFLAVRVAGDPYAIHLSEIASLHRDRKIVPLITPVPQLLGIVGFRGKLAPVYDLRFLLGYPGAQTPRWFVLARASAPVGLAFDLYESHLTATPGELSTTRESTGGFLDGVVTAGAVARTIISISSVLEAIVRRLRSDGPEKER